MWSEDEAKLIRSDAKWLLKQLERLACGWSREREPGDVRGKMSVTKES